VFMKILGVDTSTQLVTAGIVDDNRVLGEISFNLKMRQAERLLPLISNLLDEAKLEISDLDGLGVATGPGFFTSLRIGVSVVKTLAQAVDLPICGLSTLDGLAAQVYCPGLIIAGVDAGRGQLFVGFYRREQGELKKLNDYKLLNPEELFSFDLSINPEERIILIGNMIDNLGKERIQLLIENTDSGNVLFMPRYYSMRGAVVAALTEERLKKKMDDDLFSLKPFYLRSSDAQAALDNNNNLGENSGK